MRTINEIYQSILVEKISMPTLNNKLLNADGSTTLTDEQDLLNELTTTKKVSIWKLWAYMTATIIWVHESLWYNFKDIINELLSNHFLGTLSWLIDQVKIYQDGDDVIINPPLYIPYYDVVDRTKQIIQSSAGYEIGGEVFIKVRRKDTDILTNDERIRFTTYMNKIKVAGQVINIINTQADIIKLYYKIYYDAIFIETNIKNAVYEVINNYLTDIEFDSTIDITHLTDLIQEVEGVVAVEYDDGLNSAGKAFGSSIWIPIKNYYNSNAGWNIIDSLYPLTDTLVFEAHN